LWGKNPDEKQWCRMLLRKPDDPFGLRSGKRIVKKEGQING
jgi:hypothetical protein